MIDRPDRRAPRFPAVVEGEVRAAMAEILDRWQIGSGDLAVTGGARGADILFAELCLERAAHVRLLVALPDEQFVERSVRLPGTLWEARYRRLTERCELWHRPAGALAMARERGAIESTNQWILETCRAEAAPRGFYTLLVWDEAPAGDGTGGTADFAAVAGRYDTHLAVVNPLRLGDAGVHRHEPS
jgi:hypothetical protein